VLFASALHDAIAAADAVTIACQVRLCALFARSFPQARVVAHKTASRAGRLTRLVADEHWTGVDVWTPIADLARAYRSRIEDFAGRPAYLRPDPGRVAGIRRQLAAAPGLKVGIVWKSLVMTPKRARFFAPFAAWAPLLRVDGASFYSLQYGDAAAEHAYAAERIGVPLRQIEGLDVKDDLDGVAAAGLALDLVVGPMNASSNLAAAAGAPVWMVERNGAWPMLGCDDLPWYREARVFRVGADGQWRSVFSEMADALSARVAALASAA